LKSTELSETILSFKKNYVLRLLTESEYFFPERAAQLLQVAEQVAKPLWSLLRCLRSDCVQLPPAQAGAGSVICEQSCDDICNGD